MGQNMEKFFKKSLVFLNFMTRMSQLAIGAQVRKTCREDSAVKLL